MFFLIFLVCVVTAVVLFVLIKKLAINKLPAFFRVVFSIVTFLLFFGSSILFFGITAARIGLKNMVDSGGNYVEELIYESFPENSMVQEGFDLSFIFEYQDICIVLANMLDSDDGMMDGITLLLFDENSFIGPLVMDNIVRPIYPSIKDYILDYAQREYPEIYNMLWDFYVNVFNLLLYQIDAIDSINNALIEQFSGNYIITVNMLIEMIKTPIKSYITTVTSRYQFTILLINGIYIGVFIVIGILMTKRARKKIVKESKSPVNNEDTTKKEEEKNIQNQENHAAINASKHSENKDIEEIIKNGMPNDKSSFFYKNIPENKENIAKESYVKLQEGERILWLHDSTVFGGGKEGICLTDRGIYWKKIDYDEGKYIQYENIEYMEVKGKFFNKFLFINGEQLEMCPHSDELMSVINKIKGNK